MAKASSIPRTSLPLPKAWLPAPDLLSTTVVLEAIADGELHLATVESRGGLHEALICAERADVARVVGVVQDIEAGNAG